MPVQLVHQVVLAEAKVRVAAGRHLVGVVVAVLVRVDHERPIQVGLHVWADVT